MKFTFKPSPNYNNKQSTQSIMFELTLGLLVVYAFAVYYYYTEFGASYGIRTLQLLAVSVLSAVLTETIWFAVRKQNIIKELKTSFPWVTAIILALMVPVNMTFYGLAVSTVLAILFGKLVFGGFGNNIFNPAAFGRAIIAASFAGAVATDFVTGATPTATMASSGWITSSQTAFDALMQPFGGLQNLAVGLYPGALGETSAIVILLVGLYLAVRKVIDWRVPVVYIGVLFGLTWMVGLMHGQGLYYPLFHVLSGGALFGAVFMMTDPVTNPTSAAGRIIFAIGCAILTIIIRLKANLPEGVLYSILLMNMLSPLIEQLTDGQQLKKKKRNWLLVAGVVAFGIVTVGISGATIEAKEVVIEEPADALTFGEAVSLDSDLSRFDAQVTDQDNGVYVVAIKGYGLIEGDPEHGDYARNEFEVVVTEGSIESVKVVTFGDTKGIGDIIENEAYQELFSGLAVNDFSATVDTITGATWSSKSMIAAVQAVMQIAE
ncbi:MAG: RnfABCDGE type electron transport complex subunit D [Anaerorhabdus sp.]